jgi:hypothetical protein
MNEQKTPLLHAGQTIPLREVISDDAGIHGLAVPASGVAGDGSRRGIGSRES